MKQEIRKIQKATLNRRKVKLFELWEKRGEAWFFCGHHSAPARTANKNLFKTINE